ncbi:MAG: filamentous hemagglutinin family protein [Thermodesulfobacteriota bacterium]
MTAAGKPNFARANRFWTAIICGAVLMPLMALAGPTIPGFYGSSSTPAPNPPAAGALPVVKEVVQNATLEKKTDTNLVVHQTDSKAVINWKSFNIGAKAWTHFDQQGNTDWTALNRIYDHNPSQIFGRLTADGRVYLINQNGILFGPGSQVNVHTLTASALNISDGDFLDNILHFNLENYTGREYGEDDIPLADRRVSNHGDIQARVNGSVFLLGPHVENSGAIDAPYGQAALGAGTAIRLENAQDYQGQENSTRVARLVNVTGGGGTADNFAGAELTADQGVAGMYGGVVNQEGLIRSVTAVKKAGRIELIAADKIRLGEESCTLSPVSTSTEAVHESFTFQGGEIYLQGHDPDQAWQFDATANDNNFCRRIELYGDITAPSGKVYANARERLYMDDRSTIDVGASVVALDAGANILKAQLNSVEMRDDYGQKGGILQGETIYFDAHAGSAVGNMSQHLASEEKTALERSAETSGTIQLAAKSGDLIIRENARLDFAGGGVWYNSGNVATTKLVSGRRVYDISAAPQWIAYDTILGDNVKGVSYGGPAGLKEYGAMHFEGSDAGILNLYASRLVLDGELDGRAFAGAYQTLADNPTDEYGDDAARGLAEPQGGSLTVGYDNKDNDSAATDRQTERIVLKQAVAPATEMTAETPYYERYPGKQGLVYSESGDAVQTSYLATEKLNAAGLGSISLNANTEIRLETGADLELAPGASLTCTARGIDINSSIHIPSGTVNLTAQDSHTGFAGDTYVAMPEQIHLGEHAVVSTAGERVDNTRIRSGEAAVAEVGRLDGGNVYLDDRIDTNMTGNQAGVLVDGGARVDVSAGWRIDREGGVTGGDAGTLRLQSAMMALDGSLQGLSLSGSSGGKLEIQTRYLTIASAGADPARIDASGMVLADDRFADSGFGKYKLWAVDDVRLLEGVRLTPSLTKLADPVPSSAVLPGADSRTVRDSGAADSANVRQTLEVSVDDIGATSISLQTDKSFEGIFYDAGELNTPAEMTIAAGAVIALPPEGSIFLKSAGAMEMAGELMAPAGAIDLATTYTGSDLTIGPDAVISAAGYNRPEAESPLSSGMPVHYTPLDGGNIRLNAGPGSLVVGENAVLDVSGSATVEQVQASGDGAIQKTIAASEPGSIELAFYDSLDISSHAELLGNAALAGLPGGALTIERTNPSAGLSLSAAGLQTSADGVVSIQPWADRACGFDALTIRSGHEITFMESLNLRTARSITLDAPLLRTRGMTGVTVEAPWVTLGNTTNSYGADRNAGVEAGNGVFQVLADWIDLKGDIRITGVAADTPGVRLVAERDIRLDDEYYVKIQPAMYYQGLLSVPGDITMTAARIYPTTQTDFTISTGGTLTTAYSFEPIGGPVYSAASSLTILAGSLHHQGALLSPMGRIVLAEDMETRIVNGVSIIDYLPMERVFLAPGSLLSVKGDARVNYGGFDEQAIAWRYIDKAKHEQVPTSEIQAAPERSITIEGREVIVRNDAEIDVSGGGSLFGYRFLKGIEGSLDPLGVGGRYVILPDNRFAVPGRMIHLSGVDGLKEGNYYLLPEEFAFLEDAIVITDLGVNLNPVKAALTEEGYPIVTGQSVFSESGGQSPVVHEYSVRKAEDVRKEGYFAQDSLPAADAGDIVITGASTVFDGDISADPLTAEEAGTDAGGKGGLLSLSGVNITVGAVGGTTAIDFEDELSADMLDQLIVGPEALAGGDLSKIVLGDPEVTQTIVIGQGGKLAASEIDLTAAKDIQVAGGAEIVVREGAGKVDFSSGKEIRIDSGAEVSAAEISLDTHELVLEGDVNPGESLTLAGDSIYLVDDGYGGSVADLEGLVLREGDWAKFNTGAIKLQSRSVLTLIGEVDLDVSGGAGALSIDTAGIRGRETTAISTLTAGAIRLTNTGAGFSDDGGESQGRLELKAGDRFTVGPGEMRVRGFETILLAGGEELVFQGAGSLVTGNAHLLLESGVVRTSAFQEKVLAATGELLLASRPADFRIQTGSGDLRIMAPQAAGGSTGATAVAGSLSLEGDGVFIGSLVDVAGGSFKAVSHGEGVVLETGGRIAAVEEGAASGGRIELAADNGGSVTIMEGSRLDVSGGGDAGSIHLTAPRGGATVDGELRAEHGAAERGGEFSLDTGAIDDFASLSSLLADGGFDEAVSLRSRTGDVNLSADIAAHEFALTVDGGGISLTHAVQAGGMEGGRVELNAVGDIVLSSGARIDAGARETGQDGGFVQLHSSTGAIDLQGDSEILVSGAGTGQDGEVLLRAGQNGTAGPAMTLNGNITGAAAVNVESVTVYKDQTSIDSARLAAWKEKLRADMNAMTAGGVKNRMTAGLNMRDRSGASLSGDEETARLHLKPGLEVRSTETGGLSLDTDWTLHPASAADTGWRFGGEAGALTLRSAGDLTVNGSIIDNPSASAGLSLPAGLDSWDIRFTAGADLAGADPGAAITGSGDLKIQNNRQIYTESGRIMFSSAGDAILGATGSVSTTVFPYCLATHAGDIRGRVGRNLELSGSDIQSGTGDIGIDVGGNLIAGQSGSGATRHVGSIRTTGEAPGDGATAKDYWDYRNGGDIEVNVGGDVLAAVNRNAWDSREQKIDLETQTVTYMWSPSFKGVSGTQGFATLGGGNLSIQAGGDFIGQGGAFGPGDVIIDSGNDLDGYFLVNQGRGLFTARGNYGLNAKYPDQSIELMAATAEVRAGGSVYLGTVFNPTIAGDVFWASFGGKNPEWNMTYACDGWDDPENPGAAGFNSGISLTARAGDVLLSGEKPPGSFTESYLEGIQRLLPPVVSVSAFRDIYLENDFFLAPSPKGNLTLSAGRDIHAETGKQPANLVMSDLDPATLYGRQTAADWNVSTNADVSRSIVAKLITTRGRAVESHSARPVHADDDEPVRIQAGNDIIKLKMVLPKQAEITAGHDLVDIGYMGQNVREGDESRVRAGHDIRFSAEAASTDSLKYIWQGGPGLLLVSAGNRIDLGASDGIEATGTLWNPALPDTSGVLAVASGYDLDRTEAEFRRFFSDLKAPGKEVAEKLARGEIEEGQARAREIKEEQIDPFLSAGAGEAGSTIQSAAVETGANKGDIDMVLSRIDSLGSRHDVYIAAAGTMNVGRSTLDNKDSSRQTGIFTAGGGEIGIYSAEDVNVNESRVMTFFGGDILTWSDGNINAGRGSRTAINLQSAKLTKDKETGAYSVQFQPPAVGSGMRTLTFDPDGAGPEIQPEYGDIYLVAPYGEIDAGEAGIAGRNIFLGAKSVVNVQNISFSQGAIGVPSASETAAGLGSLTGGGAVSEAAKMSETAGSAMEEANKRFEEDAKAMEETFMPSWLRVEFMGFDVEDGGWTEEDENDKKP